VSRFAGGDVVLDGEELGEGAVVLLGPDMGSRTGVDQLDGDAYSVPDGSEAALDHVFGSQLPADASDVDGPAFELKSRVASDDLEPRGTSQERDDVFGQTIREQLVLFRLGHARERQDGDGG
jgi:hypothetical protein